ncbi:alpha/beta hydrolase [Croceivirga thetidis]|uniref:Alpha/beta hydrolase n=1 Tax=Croceivirga thetidis TaxID=2721623 RepID=A0ABX1GL08_9FLAO|nr:alpha/beta hydrolase [Croceivirga thetidis]NKI30590.1 alpha/beta hydrolase [Croceivirga thetidis]
MRLLTKLLKFFVLIVLLLGLVYLLGPRVETPKLNPSEPKVSMDLMVLEKEINQREAAIANIKPDNETRIIWADSIPKKTEYSIVYLHGWSASQEEGDPIHQETAKRYGVNLYLPRLAGHGLEEEEPMLDITADALFESANEAIAVGKQLGEKVILMSTSTGGTLALPLAAGDSDIVALILYSPNVEIFDPTAKLLSKPWGLQLARLVTGNDYNEFDNRTALKDQYWTTKYRLEALTQLQALVEETMVEETFKAVEQPVFMGYYYKDDVHQDSVVSVPAMLKMFDELGTPENLKEKVAFPNVGDHVLGSYIESKDLESVKNETFEFLEEIVGLKPKPIFTDVSATMATGTN